MLLVLLCVHWQVGSSEPGRIMRRQRKARSFAFAFVALLLLPLNQTGKRAEAKATQTQTANLEELPCGAAVCMAPMWGERAC